ncbi:MAG: extradiol dioxygenase [Blastocatellia bacterium]|nr:MAG: extradiol dioxygenase [Blastocatellia bacterium]
MLIGVHAVIASKDAEADRKFMQEVLKLSVVDAGGGYLIFGLPPAEASIHESDSDKTQHELYFLCENVEAFIDEMKKQNVACADVQDTGWGRLTQLTLPSGGKLSVYQPRHARPAAQAAG